MKGTSILCALALAAGLTAAAPAHAASTTCEMRFTLSGWSAIYKTAKGTGRITCDNGEKATVHLKATGGAEYRVGAGFLAGLGAAAAWVVGRPGLLPARV